MNKFVVPAALSTIFATLAGFLTNVFTNGWSVPVGVGLFFLVVLWFVFEWRVNKPKQEETKVDVDGGEEVLATVTSTQPERPGTPSVWNVPSHNNEFTGRESILASLKTMLNPQGKERAQPVQVLRGIPGVGKTQLAIEYAWRNEADYDTVWWINSEDVALIREQLAALAIEMKLVSAGTPSDVAANAVKAKLRVGRRWLLIFDNAEDTKVIDEVLPGGVGHVLITSRTGGWEAIGHTNVITTMERNESVDLLRAHDHDLVVAEARQLADELGDLPLALVQAGGYLAETGISVRDYLDELRSSAAQVMHEGMTGSYPTSLAAAILLTINKQERDDPVGLAIVRLGAFLAPESIPVQWLTKVDSSKVPHAEVIVPLIDSTAKPRLIANGVKSANRFGLITVTHQGFSLHRLVQLVIRDQLEEYPDQAAFRAYARAALVSHRPGDSEQPENWADWARVVPHLLAVEPSLGTEEKWCEFACDASWYMIERGDSVPAAALAKDLRDRWIRSLGRDHPMTLLATRCLARAMRENGDWEEAKEVYADALERYKRVLGELDTNTLRLQHGGAINLYLLGRYEEALAQQTDAWQKYRQVKGDDFLHTLHAANHAANALRELGRVEEAREWHAKTLELYKSTVGEDNPDTLRCANNLALDLRKLGQFEQARGIQEDTYARRRKVLGENNRYTLESANTLGETLYELDLFDRARKLLEETLNRCRTYLTADHPESLSCAVNLAQIQLALGQVATAQNLAADTYARYMRKFGARHPGTVRAGKVFIEILEAAGQQADADRIRRQLGEQ